MNGLGRAPLEDHRRDRPEFPGGGDLFFLLATFVYLYLILFVLPGTPIYLDGDGDVYLANAKRMFEGEVMYRDFAQFTTPGTEVVYSALFNIFGPRLWVGNAMLVVLGLTLAWLTLRISRKVLTGWYAFLPALLFLTLFFRNRLEATHYWFSIVAVVSAVAVVLEERTPARLVVAGTLCGTAVWFTQVHGLMAVLGLGVFLVWEWQQKKRGWHWLLQSLGTLVASLLVAVVFLSAYFVWQAGLRRFLDSTIIFGLKYFRAESRHNSWEAYLLDIPRMGAWRGLGPLFTGLFVYPLVPFVYVAFQIRYRRDVDIHPRQTWDGLMLLQAVGLCLFLGVAPAPGLWRLHTVTLPATILIVWILSSRGRMGRAILAALAAGTLVFAFALSVRTQTCRWTFYDLPAGRAAFQDPPFCEMLQWVLGHTRPGEFFLYTGGTGPFQCLAGVRNPGPVQWLTSNDYTRPEQVREVVGGLEKHQVRFVVWHLEIDMPDDAGPAGDHLGPLRAYLHEHYRVVKTFTRLGQVWERVDSVSR